jgi:hypothetical protein
LVTFKGWVEVDEVDTVIFDMLAEDIKIVDKIEVVHEGPLRTDTVLSAPIMNDHACQDIFERTLRSKGRDDQPPSSCFT